MANRHSNKRLRAAIRRRMTATGEAYQKAREHVLFEQAATRRPRDADLFATDYFGIPITIATFETLARPIVMIVGGPLSSASLLAKSPLLRMRPRGVQ